MVTVARVVAAHGIRGEVRLALETDFPERFAPPVKVWVGEHQLTIVKSRPHRGGRVVAFEGRTTRDDALALVGSDVRVDEADRWPLDEGRHYVDEVIGLEAFDRAGRRLGRVSGVLSNPAHDLYEIDGGAHLVPAHREWVRLDLIARRLDVLRPLEVESDAD